MKQWFSASELAGLPGISSRSKDVPRAAKRNGWQSRKRQARGGGLEYFIESLPPETQAALAQESQSPEPTVVLTESEPPQPNHETKPTNQPTTELTWQETDLIAPTNKQERVKTARMILLEAVETWCEVQGIDKKVDCQGAFATAYNAGEVRVPDWVKLTVKNVSRSTLCNWEKACKQKGIAGLRRNAPEKNTLIDSTPEMAETILKMIGQSPHLNATHIYQGLSTQFPIDALPSLPTLRRWINTWKRDNAAMFMLLANPDGYKNKFMPAFGSYSENIDHPNQLWELDSSPADVMLIDGRYNLCGVIDVYTRRTMLLVSKTSNASAIIALLRKAILEWGVPDAIKTDNGKDYVARHIRHSMKALGIDHYLCNPFSPEQKPHIERFFGTFTRDLVEMLPGYLGHSVADRKQLQGQKSFAERFGDKKWEIELDLKRFQEFCNGYCKAVYGTRKHGTTGKAPEHSAAGFPIQVIEDEQVLNLLMMPGGERSVRKKGIQIGNTYYIAPEMALYMNERVHCRFPDDLGTVYVYKDIDCSQFLFVAEAPELTGISRSAVQAESKKYEKQQKAAVRFLRRKDKDGINVAALPEQLVDQAAKNLENVRTLPGKSERYIGGAIEVAAQVVEALTEKPAPYVPSPERVAEVERQIEETYNPPVEEHPHKRYDRLLALKESGAELSEEDARFVAYYPRSGASWQSYLLIKELEMEMEAV
jgi:putative transposase